MFFTKYFSLFFLFFFSECVFADKITINYYTWRYPDHVLWQEINQREIFPDVFVKVRTLNRDHYEDTVKLLLQSGHADFFAWPSGSGKLKTLVDHGYIEPFLGDLSMMNLNALSAAKGVNGKVYGVPSVIHLESLMVNMKVLKKHGLGEAPKNLEEFEKILTKLNSLGITPIYLPGREDWYLAQVLGEVLVAGLVDPLFGEKLIDGMECFDSPEYTQVFEVLKRWIDKGFLNEDMVRGNYREMFTSVSLGRAAMSFEGGWMTSKSEPYYRRDPSYEFGFWPVPGGASKFYVHGDGTFQAGTSSRYYPQAKRVLEFTATKQFAQLFVKYAQQLPAYGGDLQIEPGDLATMSKLASQRAYPVSLFSAYELNQGEPSYNTLLIRALRGVLNKVMSPAEAGESIQQGLNNWDKAREKNCSE